MNGFSNQKSLKLLDYDEPNSILSQGQPLTTNSKSSRQFMSLPTTNSSLIQQRNYSFNTIDNRDKHKEKLHHVTSLPLQTVTSDKKSSLSRKNTFAELADQLKNLLKTIRFPANIKSRE